MNKIYFENERWAVFLNVRNNIKVKNKKADTVHDYIKEIYANEDFDCPKYVRKSCVELHGMFHNKSIYTWIYSYTKGAKKK